MAAPNQLRISKAITLFNQMCKERKIHLKRWASSYVSNSEYLKILQTNQFIRFSDHFNYNTARPNVRFHVIRGLKNRRIAKKGRKNIYLFRSLREDFFHIMELIRHEMRGR